MEQQHTGTVLSAGKELGEMTRHGVVIVAHQHALRLRSARQHLWVGDAGKRRRVRCLEVNEWLATQETSMIWALKLASA